MVKLFNLVYDSLLCLEEAEVDFSSTKGLGGQLWVKEDVGEFVSTHDFGFSGKVVSSWVHSIELFDQRHVFLEHQVAVLIPQFTSSPDMGVELAHEFVVLVVKECC